MNPFDSNQQDFEGSTFTTTSGYNNSQAFDKVESQASEKTKSESAQLPESGSANPKRDGKFNGVAQEVVQTFTDNLPTSVFILSLAGYVVIEAFGKEGVDFGEYLGLLLLLLLGYFFVRFLVAAERGIVDFLKSWKIFFISVGVFALHAIINHYEWIMVKCKLVYDWLLAICLT
jgi:uncharacterized membrane protein